MFIYKGYSFHPYSKQITDRICPFCNYDGQAINNVKFTIHMRRCFLQGLKQIETAILVEKEDVLFNRNKP